MCATHGRLTFQTGKFVGRLNARPKNDSDVAGRAIASNARPPVAFPSFPFPPANFITMSRQHSPSPGHPMHSNPPYQLHTAASSSSQTNVSVSVSNGAGGPGKAQQKPKGFAPGITASAEDVKYQTKHKELKRKVKEIELVRTMLLILFSVLGITLTRGLATFVFSNMQDNDKLYLKLLLAKKNIRRMNLERACVQGCCYLFRASPELTHPPVTCPSILYERLAAVPPTPGRHSQDLPPEQDPVFAPPQPPQDHPRGPDVNDHALAEYLHAHPNARIVRGTDGNVIAIEDTPPVDPRGPVALSGPPPPHGIPLVHNFQHESGPGFDPQRPLPALPPVGVTCM